MTAGSATTNTPDHISATTMDEVRKLGELGMSREAQDAMVRLSSAGPEERVELAQEVRTRVLAAVRSMTGFQQTLFEWLLIVNKFGLHEALGHETIREFLEAELREELGTHRETLQRLAAAVAEHHRLEERFGMAPVTWTPLRLLAPESVRQSAGKGRLSPERYEELSKRVAAGQVTHRELQALLRGAGAARSRDCDHVITEATAKEPDAAPAGLRLVVVGPQEHLMEVLLAVDGVSLKVQTLSGWDREWPELDESSLTLLRSACVSLTDALRACHARAGAELKRRREAA